MRCGRCRGLLVVDYFIDMQDNSGHLWLRAWRCVNCGEVVEPGILRHRSTQPSRLPRFVEWLTRRRLRPYEVVPLGV